MAFPRPTLTELRQQVATDINAQLPGVDALLRYSNLGILGDVVAGQSNGHYGYLDYIAKNGVPFTATGEYLEGWAGLKGVARKAATSATGTIVFTGTDGAVIPSGTPLNRSDGAQYLTTATGTIASGTATVAAQAVAAGTASNTGAGVTMILSAGISGVNGAATVGTAFTGGTEVESDFSLRSRMLAAYAAPPQGGSYSDYAEWALEVAGVTRVWPMPGTNPGTVFVYFMMDDVDAAFGGFPQGTNGVAALETRDTVAAGDQLALANALFVRQPVHVLLYAKAPTANTINLTIAGLASAGATIQAEVTAAIASALRFGSSPGGTTDLSEIEYAIALIAGTNGFVITAMTASAGTISPSGLGNVTSSAGAIPVLGTITWT
jgi:uncharacterized phage protein gp47/JayE